MAVIAALARAERTSTGLEKLPRKAKTPRAADGSNVAKLDNWDGFQRKRHHKHPDPIFDEGELKFDQTALSSARKAGLLGKVGGSTQLNGVMLEPFSARKLSKTSPPREKRSLSPEISLRKMRFFDGCLRAERAQEIPQLSFRDGPSGRAPTSARDRRSPREGEMSSMEPPRRPSIDLSPKPTLLLPLQANVQAVQQLRRLGAGEPLSEDVAVAAAPGSETLSRAVNGFVSSCRSEGINPSTIGIIRTESSRLQLEFGCMTDKRAKAITEALKASSSDIRHVHLRSNGLTEKGAQKLISALPETVQSIDLSQNDLGHSDTWCRCFQRITHLRSLNLSDSQLGDVVCKSLCETLASCRALHYLNLSANNLYMGGRDIAAFVRNHYHIQELDVHWNHIVGDSARELSKSFYDNYMNSGDLREVSLAWNPLGKVNGEETCKQLAQVFAEATSITHMDLTKCELRANHCQILADGLRDNKTIFGIHISGNEAFMNQSGIIVPRHGVVEVPMAVSVVPAAEPPPPSQQGLVATQGLAASSCASVPAESKAAAATDAANRERTSGSHCWVCERWRETRFSYTPGISGPEASNVWLFTCLDDFDEGIPMTKHGSDFVTYVMAPPGSLWFVFQAGMEVCASRMAPLRVLPAKIRVRRAGLNGDWPEVGGSGSGGNSSTEVELSIVNCCDVLPREEGNPVCLFCVPRRGAVFDDIPPVPKWSLGESLFASHDDVLACRTFCAKCFDLDWRFCDADSIIPNDADRINVRKIFRDNYNHLYLLFISLCCLHFGAIREAHSASAAVETVASDRIPQSAEEETKKSEDRPSLLYVCGIGLHEYTHMLAQHSLISEEFDLRDADAQFILSAIPPGGESTCRFAPQHRGSVLLRHGFIGLLIRLSFRVFGRHFSAAPGSQTSKQRSKIQTVADALDHLLSAHICASFAPFSSLKNIASCIRWRHEVLHTEAVEMIFRKHTKSLIVPLFETFSLLTSEKARFVRLQDWFLMLDAIGAFPCSGDDERMNTWDRVWLWKFSATPQIDEMYSASHCNLSFVGFLEAIGRLALLQRSRRLVKKASEAQCAYWDYGMDFPSPVSIFCADQTCATDPKAFASCLDEFFCSQRVANAVADSSSLPQSALRATSARGSTPGSKRLARSTTGGFDGK